jgi:hypothetical protein
VRRYGGDVARRLCQLVTSRPWRRRVWALVLVSLSLPLVSASAASALADPTETLTYMPTELVHSIWTPGQVGGFLAELDEYDIGQALLQMPRFRGNGKIKLPASNEQMLGVWAAQAASYNAEHGTAMTVTAVFNGVPKRRAFDLERASTRANLVAAVESALATGISGVQLDIEPYPTGPGFIELLEALDATFARLGFHGRLSVVAPADTATWPPAYLERVGELVDQLDPTFYDSELESAGAFEEWIEQGLAYYSANAPAATRIVPVLPSYAPDPWHDPAVENIADATDALAVALAEGSRVNGAGIWWWYAFYYEDHGRFPTAADRAAWRSSTLELPFSP